MVSFDPKVEYNNPFAGSISSVNYGGGSFSPKAVSEEPTLASAGVSERHGRGQAVGRESNGLHGEVKGVGKDGEFVLKGFDGGALYA